MDISVDIHEYIHGYPRKICGYGYGYGRQISYPRQACETPLPIGAKLSQISFTQASYSQFCPKFRWHGNGDRSGKNAIGSIRWPIPETPYRPRRKNLAKISYASRIIANFVPNFVAMATGVGRGKM